MLVGSLMIVGCGNSSSSESTASTTAPTKATEGKKKLNVVMIAKSNSNPVFPVARTGAEAKAKELAAEGIEVKIDWQTPDDEDGQVQAQRIEQAVTNGADAIMVACSDAAKVNTAINAAVDKGVPVMTFDSDAPDSKRFAFYGTDDIELGTMIAEELGKLTGGKGVVAMTGGNQNAPNLQNRIKGIKDTLAAKYPEMKILEVYYHPETPQDAASAVESAMRAHPEITAWAMPGGWALFSKSLLTLDPKKMTIVSADCLPPNLEYVDKGIAPVLLAQPVYNWGYEGLGILVDKLAKQKEVPVINKMKLERIDKARLGEWAKTLKDWGFTDVDPKFLK